MHFDLPRRRALSQGQLDRIWLRLAKDVRQPVLPQRRLSFRRSGLLAAGLALVAALAGALILSGSVLGNDPPPWVNMENEWRQALDDGAKQNPDAKFANLAPAELLDRLETASKQDQFEVVSVTFLKPKGVAPLVVVRAQDESAFAKRVPALLASIDPKAPDQDDRVGWAFEGFFFKAVDANDNPFLAIENHWRDDGAGGGQWARSPDLLPFKTLAHPVG